MDQNNMPNNVINGQVNGVASSIPVQSTAPTQATLPVQNTILTQPTVPVQTTTPAQNTVSVQNTVPTQATVPVQASIHTPNVSTPTVPIQSTVAPFNQNVNTQTTMTSTPVMGNSDLAQNHGALNNTEQTLAQQEQENAEVTKIISSTIVTKEKVNLLTPDQKAEIERKREEARKEKENYKAPSVGKFKLFFMFSFLIIAIVVVLFLPEISAYLGTLQKEETHKEEEVIVSGTLRCQMERVDDKFNVSYTYNFDFKEGKLKKTSYYEATTGDALVDATELENKLNDCKNLRNMTGPLPGIKVSCSLSGGTLTREQIFDYTNLNPENAVTAYMEAGGEYPGEFQLDSEIDGIEKNMKSIGYSCERHK